MCSMPTNYSLDLLGQILEIVNSIDYRDDDARMAEIRRVIADA